jgi:hypothetical protein
MAVRQADEDAAACRRGLVVALQLLPGLDQRERLRGVDAEGLEHLGCEDFAHAALEGKAPVGAARPRRAARALGREIEQAAVLEVITLGEEKAAAVAEVGVVKLELVTVIAEREGLFE